MNPDGDGMAIFLTDRALATLDAAMEVVSPIRVTCTPDLSPDKRKRVAQALRGQAGMLVLYAEQIEAQ